MSKLSPIKLILDLTRYGQISSAGYSEKNILKAAQDEDLWIGYFKINSRSGAPPIRCPFGAPNRFTMPWSQMLISKAKGWRPLNGLLLKSTQSSGLHQLGAPLVHPTDTQYLEAKCWFQKHKDKDFLLLKSTQSSGATPNGCTFGAPNRGTNGSSHTTNP